MWPSSVVEVCVSPLSKTISQIFERFQSIFSNRKSFGAKQLQNQKELNAGRDMSSCSASLSSPHGQWVSFLGTWWHLQLNQCTQLQFALSSVCVTRQHKCGHARNPSALCFWFDDSFPNTIKEATFGEKVLFDFTAICTFIAIATQRFLSHCWLTGC